jgi:hypothetical protein
VCHGSAEERTTINIESDHISANCYVPLDMLGAWLTEIERAIEIEEFVIGSAWDE